MQAVILAGGKGTRLHPLTSNTPKPMVRLFDKPVLEHTIQLLRKHNVRDIILTVAYKAENIMDYFGSGSKWGVNIQYCIEESPMGTAGGLRRLQPLLKDTFTVIPGDAVTDLDLSFALDFHKRKSAIATLLTHEVEDTTQFGIVDACNDGRIRRFQEKPKSSEAFSNEVNTGFYIFEPEILNYIPYDSPYDFSKNVFPNLLHNHEPFFACRSNGYWCDIGSLAQYRNAHFDALLHKVELDIPATEVAPGMWIADDADVHPTAWLHGPVFVGRNARIERRSWLGRFSVVGSNSRVHQEAKITHSVLGAGSFVGSESAVIGSVVGPKYKLQEGRQIEDQIIVHNGSDFGLRAEIDSALLSQYITEAEVLTWSGLEAARVLSQFAMPQPLAA